MIRPTLVARAPLPSQSTPPIVANIVPRSPCEDCTPEVIQTWIPVDVTTSSCDTSSTTVWWTPTPTTETQIQTATPSTPPPTPTLPLTVTRMDSATVTATVTVTQVAMQTSDAVASATCCVRDGRWPNGQPLRQVPWQIQDGSERDRLGIEDPDVVDARARQRRSYDDAIREPLVPDFDSLRLRRSSEMFLNADLLAKRWENEATEVITVTAVQTRTSTSTQWSPAVPTAVPVPIQSGQGPSGTANQQCQSVHWCNPQKTGPASVLDQVCGCVVAWVTVIYGGVPGRSNDLAASMAFFFAFLLFTLVALLRLFACRKNWPVMRHVLPMGVFATGMVAYFGTRAWTSNNVVDIPHVVALHTMLMCVPLFLVEASLQLFGLLANRAERGGWIRCTSYVLRAVNLVMLVIYIIAACNLQSFLSAWVERGDNCDASSSQDLALLPLVADWFLIFCQLVVAALTVLIRIRHCLPIAVLVHILFLCFFLVLHFLWRTMRDWSAEAVWTAGWEAWEPPSSATGLLEGHYDARTSCWGVLSTGYPDWIRLANLREGAETPWLFYMLGIVPLLATLLLLFMANLPVYLSATPVPPPPKPDPKARYKMTYNPSTQRMELSRVDEAELAAAATAAAAAGNAADSSRRARAVDTDGKPYYKLVRSNAGRWKFKGVDTVPSGRNGMMARAKQVVLGYPC